MNDGCLPQEKKVPRILEKSANDGRQWPKRNDERERKWERGKRGEKEIGERERERRGQREKKKWRESRRMHCKMWMGNEKQKKIKMYKRKEKNEGWDVACKSNGECWIWTDRCRRSELWISYFGK